MKFLGLIDFLLSVVFMSILGFTLAVTALATYYMYQMTFDKPPIPIRTERHIVYTMPDCWDDIKAEKA